MEEGEKLYYAMPTPKPTWDQLGDVTKNVWRGYAAKGVTVHDYRAGVKFTREFEKLLVERILPLCSLEETIVLYKNSDPSWPFPLSALDPHSPVGKALGLHELVPGQAPAVTKLAVAHEEEVKAEQYETIDVILPEDVGKHDGITKLPGLLKQQFESGNKVTNFNSQAEASNRLSPVLAEIVFHDEVQAAEVIIENHGDAPATVEQTPDVTTIMVAAVAPTPEPEPTPDLSSVYANFGGTAMRTDPPPESVPAKLTLAQRLALKKAGGV